MTALYWIVGSGILMGAIAFIGSVTLLLSAQTLQRVLLPLVALAAGSLLGGAVFHMLPAALAAVERSEHVWGAFVLGFALFMVLEQFMHWHHCHRAEADCRKPLTYLILLGTGCTISSAASLSRARS